MTNESGMQVDLLGGLKRRGYMASVTAGGITLLVYWIAMGLPNEYTASAVLLVEPQAVSEQLVEAGASSIDLTERLNLMTAEILSRTRLSKIIEKLQLYKELEADMTREEIVDFMRSQTSVRPVLPELTRGMRKLEEPEINTFQIFFTSDSAKTAADVAQRLANDFIQEHISDRVKMTQTSLEFISAEEVRLASGIEEIDAALADIKEKHEASLPENLASTQRTLERNLSDRRYAQRQLDTAKSDLSFWEHQFRAAQAMGRGDERDPFSPTRRIQALQLEMKEMIARGFTERHPDMISLKAEVESNRRGLREAEARAESAEEPELLSFTEQSAAAEMQRAELKVTAFQQEIDRINESVEELRANIAGTPRVAEQMETLERQHKHLSQSLLSFSNLRFEAAVQADMERRQLGERFRILESAIPPREISSPNRRVILILGLIFGLTIGVVVGVIAEGTDPSFHQERDLQSSVGIPVLAVIPAISFDEDLERQRHVNSMRAIALAGATAFGLLGGFGTYIFVNGAPGWLKGLLKAGVSSEEGTEETEGEREAFRYQVTDRWV